MPAVAAPTGAGTLCYTTAAECNVGVNPCNATFPCSLNDNVCGTGSASNANAHPPFAYYCELSTPTGAAPNGGGQVRAKPSAPDCRCPPVVARLTAPHPAPPSQLCYDSPQNCTQGPNACGSSLPCTFDAATCATGIAGSLNIYNYYCESDNPPGAVPNMAGMFCYVCISPTPHW